MIFYENYQRPVHFKDQFQQLVLAKSLAIIIHIRPINFIMQLNPEQSTHSKIKLVQGNPSLIHDNPLNSSSSKMQYSIPKSKRWSQDKSNQSKPSFYDLPSINSNRSTSFGYGNKIDIGKRGTITPSPLNYTIHGDFDRTERKNGITMGLGRENVKNVNTYGIKPFKVPGPQDYHANKSTIELSPPKYSISARHELQSKWQKSIPGPGKYNTIEVTKNNFNLTLAKFQSSPSVSFGKNKRLAQYEERIRLLKVPGPGEYKVQKATQTAAKFYSHTGRKFGKSQRQGIVEKTLSPGPGAYKLFSQFIY